MGVFGERDHRNVVLLGVGNLGVALISYKSPQLQKFKIVAASDREIRRTDRHVADVPIMALWNEVL